MPLASLVRTGSGQAMTRHFIHWPLGAVA